MRVRGKVQALVEPAVEGPLEGLPEGPVQAAERALAVEGPPWAMPPEGTPEGPLRAVERGPAVEGPPWTMPPEGPPEGPLGAVEAARLQVRGPPCQFGHPCRYQVHGQPQQQVTIGRHCQGCQQQGQDNQGRGKGTHRSVVQDCRAVNRSCPKTNTPSAYHNRFRGCINSHHPPFGIGPRDGLGQVHNPGPVLQAVTALRIGA